MSWAYGGRPESNDVDAVRLLVGDTDSDEPLVSDEEIEFALSQTRTLPGAGSVTANAIAALFSRDVDLSVSGGNYSESQRSQHYRELAQRLDKQSQSAPPRSGVSVPVPSISGVSRSEIHRVREDDDRIRPAFVRGMFSHHGHHDHEHHH